MQSESGQSESEDAIYHSPNFHKIAAAMMEAQYKLEEEEENENEDGKFGEEAHFSFNH